MIKYVFKLIRLLSTSEHINLKDCESRSSYDSVETVNDIIDITNSSVNSPQQCQLRVRIVPHFKYNQKRIRNKLMIYILYK